MVARGGGYDDIASGQRCNGNLAIGRQNPGATAIADHVGRDRRSGILQERDSESRDGDRLTGGNTGAGHQASRQRVRADVAGRVKIFLIARAASAAPVPRRF